MRVAHAAAAFMGMSCCIAYAMTSCNELGYIAMLTRCQFFAARLPKSSGASPRRDRFVLAEKRVHSAS